MTEAEWFDTDDAARMLEFLWQRLDIRPCEVDLRCQVSHMPEAQPATNDLADLERRLHRFYLACCRAIWRLLPQEESRRGVEAGERYLAGKIKEEELDAINWDVEGAAFNIDYNVDPEAIERWVEEVRSIPEAELRAMLHSPETALEIEPRELLKRAAYFADYAMIYPWLLPKGPPPKSYAPFLSADLLREFVGNPFRPARKSRLEEKE